MSANLILLIIQYFGLNVKYIFAVWSFPRGRFFLPNLKDWDSKTDYSLERVSIDKNIEDRFGHIGDMGWEERKMSHIDDDAAANSDGIFVAEIEGEIAGYITTRLNHSTRIGGIPNLAVLPQFQRRGIGRRLIEKALAYLQAEGMLYARIETLEQNPIGTSFYPAMGFTEVARQIHYIQPLSKSDVR